MLIQSHVLTCSVRPTAGIPEGLALGRAVMEAHLVAAGRFAINLPDAEPAPEGGVGPKASPVVGSRVQFFGAEPNLQAIREALATVPELLDTGDIRVVRSAVQYVCCRRIRDAVRTPATIARELRRAERKAAEKDTRITEQLRRNLLASRRDSRLPYLPLMSLSSGQTFTARFDVRTVEGSVGGEFDAYGFSKSGATVPVV
jgi:CRISPR-associated endoribonuclease Cas6/Csy4 subtype I-F